MRTSVPLIITFIAGTVIVLEFLFTAPFLTGTSTTLLGWGVVVSAFASGIGAANLIRLNYARVKRKREGWWLGLIVIAVLIAVLTLGLVVKPSGELYQFFFNNVLQPLGATLFSVNAFFILSAAYRVFRAKTAEAVVLMISAFVVMLGNVGIGNAIWSGFPVLRSWIMNVPNAAGMRGIVIGSALGAIAISLRVILGLERSHFGVGD